MPELIPRKFAALCFRAVDRKLNETSVDLEKHVRHFQAVRRELPFERRAVAGGLQQYPAWLPMTVSLKQSNIHTAQAEQGNDRQRAIMIQQRK